MARQNLSLGALTNISSYEDDGSADGPIGLENAAEDDILVAGPTVLNGVRQFIKSTFGGVGGASKSEPFVTASGSGDLTAERVLTGTANQVIVTDDGAAPATITLSAPQNLHTAADPTFNDTTVNELTSKSHIVNLVEKATTYLALSSDYVILGDATAGAFDVDLPTAASSTGRIYVIKKIDASGNAVTVDPNGAETIDGAASKALSSQFDSVRIISDGTEWWEI